ncbi:MAG: HlyD family efflux transporter periplasmic adaptor subunit [Actinomycetota bacterium]
MIGTGARAQSATGIAAVGAALLLAACATAATPTRSGLGEPPTEPPPLDGLRWVEVEPGGPGDRIDLPGRVVAQVQEVVVAPVGGRVVPVAGRPGDPVEAGQVVARVFPTSTDVEALQQLAVALEAAVAEGAPTEAIEELLAARDEAVARLAANGGGPDVAGAPPEPIEVVADTDGVVVRVDAAAGSVVASGDPIVSVGRSDALEVHVVVADEVAARLDDAAGDPGGVELTVLATGSLQAIATAALAPAASRIVAAGEPAGTTTLRLDLVDPIGLADRVRVRVEAVIAGDDDVLAVPASAIRTLDRQPFVLVDRPGGLVAVPVEVRGDGGDPVVVDGELEPGDRVAQP